MMETGSHTGDRLRFVEWSVSLILTGVILFLLIDRHRHAGGLWRDECGSVQLSLLPTWDDIREQFQFEAFPLPFPALLRGIAAVFGSSDQVYRTFGTLVGILLIASLWMNSFILRTRPPMIALTLIGLNPTFLIWATTARGYGLACVMISLAFGFLMKLQSSLDAKWIVAALLTSLLSVQFTLHNCFLLFVIAGSAIVISLIQRKIRSAAVILGIGLICVLSMLPYWSAYRNAEWTMLIRIPITLQQLCGKLAYGFSDGIPFLKAAWGILILTSTALGLSRLFHSRKDKTAEQEQQQTGRISSCLSILFISPLLYLVFLKVLSYPTQPWYYLMLMTVMACAVDLLLASVSHGRWCSFPQVLFVVFAIFWMTPLDLNRVKVRLTNMDLAARKLAEEADERDLIVLTPWFLGMTFNRYYDGPAPWTTIPALSDMNVHRYDLFKEKMQDPAPLADVVDQMKATLQNSGRIWFVGEILPVPPEGPHMLPLPPAPYTGWIDEAYRIAWSEQMTEWLSRHGKQFEEIPLQNPGPVMPTENASIWQIRGWRD